MTAFASWSARHRSASLPGADTAGRTSPSWRIRTSMALLVVACLLPGVLLSAYFIVSDYQQHKARAVRDVIATARATAASLDRDLASIESGLRVLATSTALAQDDLPAFYEQAKAVLPFQNINNYVLIDPTGQQQINTLRPLGAALPAVGGPPQLLRVFETGLPVLTDIFTGPVTGRPILALGVPVQREGRTVYSLNAGIFPERMASVLTAQRLPKDWIGAVLDARGMIVARTHEMARHVGRPAVPDLVRLAHENAEGVLETTTLEGIPVITAYSRSSISDWSVAVGIPRAGLTAGLKQSLALLLITSTLLFALALWVAWRLAMSRVVAPADRLLTRMERISRGEDPGPREQDARASLEFQALEQGFADMRARLAQRDAERDTTIARLATTLESINDGFYLLDEQWRFAYVNRRAEALLGQPRQALLGRDIWTVLAEADTAALRSTYERAVVRQQATHLQAHLPGLDLRLDIHAYPSEQGLSVYFQDVSELHAAREAREARQVAEASNQAKTEFLSRMSHELRTPLNAVLGFAQVLKLDERQPLSASQRAMVDQIESSGQHLLEMISDVLDVSRIEAGTMHIALEEIDVSGLAADCQRTMAAEARAAGLRLAVEVPQDIGRVHADKTRLKQVLLNLLSNAIKYNRADGHVTLGAHRIAGEGEGEGGERIRFSVRDSGIGMTPAQVAQLFQPFNRLGREQDGTPGTGIGLVICQRLVALMGGMLQVETLERQGSTFHFDLPAVARPTPASPANPEAHSMRTTPTASPPESAPYDTRKVLYVEDNLANRDIMTAMLGLRPQIDVQHEMTVHAAMERLDTETFDLILLDMHLPDGTGLDLLAWLHRHDPSCHTPVVIVSADVTSSTMAQAREAGARAYLQKPLDLNLVLEVVDSLLLAAQGTAAQALP